VGRLCDAVAAIAGVCQVAGYEAQAAIELESRLPDNIRLPTGEPYQSRYRFDYVADASAGSSGQSIILLDPGTLIRRAAADVLGGKQPAYIAAQFHAALVQAILDLSLDLRRMTGCGRVALSGGVFQNVALLRGAVTTLREAGFAVLLHRRVPPNDGGLALGQAAIAMRQLQPM
jgi:hydrogenase maturation protein HypF